AIVAFQTSAAGAGAVTVNVADASGATGVVAFNNGTGQTRVTTPGTVAGSVDAGILAVTGGGDLVIDAMNVTGAIVGILTENYGLGSTDITVRGLVQGATDGIDVFSSGGQAVN